MGLKQYAKCLPLLVVFLFLPVLTSCIPNADAAGSVRVSSAGDLWNLSLAINSQAAAGFAVPEVNFTISSQSIDDLEQGKTDAVLLGREPTGDELQGLTDYVIAYDAICLIIDENSYTGGVSYGGGHPKTKDTGLQSLTFDEVKTIYSGQEWRFDGFYSNNPDLDPGSWLWNVPEVAWLKQPKAISSAFIFPGGKYDTQTSLYQSLGLNENDLLESKTSFTSARYNKEEEVLAYEYTGTAYSSEYGAQDFPFKLAFASRRVMTIAPLHVPLKVLPIDGIDPLANPAAVYDGSYKLTRKIHFLVRQNSAGDVLKLAQFLQSSDGQKMLAGAGYLPLIPE
jgi:ABC-type phosphate transport system substrate-binding protein